MLGDADDVLIADVRSAGGHGDDGCLRAFAAQDADCRQHDHRHHQRRDVAGSALPLISMLMDEEEVRKRLLTRLAQIEEEARISEADRAPVSLDQESVGRLSRLDAMQVQAMALAAQRRRQAEKDRIAAALRRLDEGEFGYCTACGDDIAEGRLQHDPSVALCIGCASERG